MGERSKNTTADAITSYMKDGDMNSLVDSLTVTRDSTENIARGLEAAGVPQRTIIEMTSTISKNRRRVASRRSLKEPDKESKFLLSLMDRTTKFTGEPAAPKDAYAYLTKAIRTQQKKASMLPPEEGVG
jgi:hypothetical protein